MTTEPHFSVLLNESVDSLVVDTAGTYVDATFGRGGHTKALLARLDKSAKVLGFDKDPEAMQVAKALQAVDDRFVPIHDSFAAMSDYQAEYFPSGLDGILMDLGVSSPQLDKAERGFSFMQDGPLDMRMDPSKGISAAQWVHQTAEEDMVHVFREYGEERFAKRIARAICERRESETIDRTLQFAKIVAEANPKWERDKNPATRVFQAVRIAVNEELSDLELALEDSIKLLKPGGRIAVISFHSLEDRIVKRFFKRMSTGKQIPKEIPVMHQDDEVLLTLLGKAQKATREEVQENIRSRSAVLRVAERTTTPVEA